ATGPAGTVTIDCLLFHSATNHLLLIESKSGAHVVEDQALRYGQLQAQAVGQAAYVTLSVRTAPTIATAYLCWSEHAHRPGRRRGSHPPPPTDPCVTVSRYTALIVLIT